MAEDVADEATPRTADNGAASVMRIIAVTMWGKCFIEGLGSQYSKIGNPLLMSKPRRRTRQDISLDAEAFGMPRHAEVPGVSLSFVFERIMAIFAKSVSINKRKGNEQRYCNPQ